MLADVDEVGLHALGRSLVRTMRPPSALADERFGGLDVAFANAGVFGEVAQLIDYPDDVFDRVMAVNVRGSFRSASTPWPRCATGAA